MSDRSSTIDIKKINRKKVLDFVRENKATTKQDISHSLKMSLPTVTQYLNELCERGILGIAGEIGNTGGRNAATYSLISNAKYAIGVDVQKHSTTAVMVDLAGTMVAKSKYKIDFAISDSYYMFLGELVQEIMDKMSVANKEKVLGVGFGVPGLISQDGNTVTYGKILSFTGETCESFSKYIPFPSRLYNDANAAACAESWADSRENAFYISLSTNIGGSIIQNNKVYEGMNRRSGEVGHMTVVEGGKRCYCGQDGCLEMYCSASILESTMDGDLDLFFQKLGEDDVECRIIWNNYLRHLSLAVNNLRMLFDCDIILGGYIGALIDQHVQPFYEMMRQRNMFGDEPQEYIRPCTYKTEAIAAGAALPFIEAFFSNL